MLKIKSSSIFRNVDATRVPSHFRKEVLDEREIQKFYMKRTKMLQNFMTHSVPGEKEEFEEPESNKQVYHLMYFTIVDF